MNKNNGEIVTVCATCLSFLEHLNSHFPVTEDIKEILRCLLRGFDIDGFFQLKLPDKQLSLCEKCYKTIYDVILFKDRALKSFKELMKDGSFDTQKATIYTVSALSSTHTATGNLPHVKEINPLEPSYTEHDPLGIKPETEYIENIFIKEETDIIDVNNETYTEPVILIEYEQEQTIQNNNVGTTQNDNNTNKKLNDELFNSNVTPALYSTVEHKKNLVINKVTASNVSKQSSCHNAAPNLHNLKQINSFVRNKVTSENASENGSNINFLKHIAVYPNNKGLNNFVINKSVSTRTSKNSSSTNSYIPNRSLAAPSNDKLNQNTEARVRNVTTVNQNNKMNVGNDNSNVYSAGKNKDALQNVIHSNLLFKKSTGVNLTKNTVTQTIDNSNVRIANNSYRNNTAITNTDVNDIIIFENNETICKRIKDGDVVAQNNRKKQKIIKIDHQGTIENVEEALSKTFTESAESSKTVEKCEYVQKKWYIQIVTREEILKKMQERRNEPKFMKAPYKCDSCVYLFDNERLAEEHKKTFHSEDSEFTCFACHASFKRLTTMNAHYYEHLMDICMYYCITCDFETNHVKLMQDHICPNAGCKPLPPKEPKTMKVTKGKSLYYCPKCEYVSIHGSVVVRHYDEKHKDTSIKKCEECGKCFKNKYTLKFHMDNMHRGKKSKPEGAEEQNYCIVCDTWFSCTQVYLRHVKNKHTPIEKKLECDECEKKFPTAQYLQSHKEFHANVKAGVKNYKCSLCDKTYYTLKVLRRHVVVSHEKKPSSRDYVCEVCGKAFFTKKCLQVHSAVHSVERPFKCRFCEDTFRSNGAIYRHVKLKHKKKQNGEELRNEGKTEIKDSSKGKGQMKDRTKRRKSVESSSIEEDLVGFGES